MPSKRASWMLGLAILAVLHAPLSFWAMGQYASLHGLMRRDLVAPEVVDLWHLAAMALAAAGFVLSVVIMAWYRRWWRLLGLPGIVANAVAGCFAMTCV